MSIIKKKKQMKVGIFRIWRLSNSKSFYPIIKRVRCWISFDCLFLKSPITIQMWVTKKPAVYRCGLVLYGSYCFDQCNAHHVHILNRYLIALEIVCDVSLYISSSWICWSDSSERSLSQSLCPYFIMNTYWTVDNLSCLQHSEWREVVFQRETLKSLSLFLALSR